MRYVDAKRKQDQREKYFQFYMAEGIRMCTSNIAHAFGGSEFGLSFVDMFKPVKEETRTKEEIINHMKEKLSKLGE